MNLVVGAKTPVPGVFRVEVMVNVMKAVVEDKAAEQTSDEA